MAASRESMDTSRPTSDVGPQPLPLQATLAHAPAPAETETPISDKAAYENLLKTLSRLLKFWSSTGYTTTQIDAFERLERSVSTLAITCSSLLCCNKGSLQLSNSLGFLFGPCGPNTEKLEKVLTIRNDGDAEAKLNHAFVIQDGTHFSLSTDESGSKIPSKMHMEVRIIATPGSSTGTFTAWLFLMFGDGNLTGRPLVVTVADMEVPAPPVLTAGVNACPVLGLKNANALIQQLRAQGNDFKLDLYRPSFIPQHWIDINAQPAMVIAGTPPFVPNYSHYRYYSTPQIRGWKDLIPPLPPLVPLFDTASVAIPPLAIKTYVPRFTTLCTIELGTRIADLRSFYLYNHPIEACDEKRADTYLFVVPGVAEAAPFLHVGDVMRLRKCPGERFDGYEYEGYITSVIARKNHVYVHIPGTKFVPGETLNIVFMLNADHIRAMVRAVNEVAHWETASSLLNRGGEGFASEILFPDVEDGTILPPGEMPKIELEMFDEDLNWEQRKAVQAVIRADYGNVPFIILGPPGTGKTKTVVEAIRQVVASDPNAHILACAPSHSAADTITLRLLASIGSKQNGLFRLNPPNRTFAEVPDSILPFCESQDGHFDVPPAHKLLRYNVVVTTCVDASMLFDAGMSNRRLADMYVAYHRTMHETWPTLHTEEMFFPKPHWTHLFIDEAAQASEPETLIPLSVVMDHTHPTAASPFRSPPRKRVQVILCGDHKQLGPRIKSDFARVHDLHVSWLERLMERPLYKDEPSFRRLVDMSGPFAMQAAMNGVSVLKEVREPFVRLLRNYRSHPGTDDRLEDGGGWWNVEEAAKVVEVVDKVLNQAGDARRVATGVKLADIGVMCAFREQVKLVRQLLRAHPKKLGGVDVGTVEDYQGMERSITIISTVRSRSRFLEDDRARETGLIGFPKRLNVAITRAKALLVVIGNPHLLVHDPNWRELLTFYARNSLHIGCSLPASIVTAANADAGGALERAHIYSAAVANLGEEKWLGKARGNMNEDEMLDGMEWSHEWFKQVAEVLEDGDGEEHEGPRD
ncbi:hypothetical protein HK104_011261 [Borealophlyctis nickersoniae]|nr:hypothetical protein HK104_011261 [Borealophlyctis nickersoniae]